MTPDNEIAVRPSQAPELHAIRAGALDYPTILKLGEAFAASGMWKDVTEAGVAAIKIMAGAEMGLEPVAAMNGIDIIPGTGNRGPRMRPNADVQAWLAARAGFTYRPLEHDDTHCVLQWFENGQPIGTSEFSLDSAKRAGLVKDWGAWKTWPENMALSRAVTQGVKLFCRHVLAGKPGGLEVVTTDEYEQEYPDPRDDLMRALFATYREIFPKGPDDDPDWYRRQRLDWSEEILGRPILSWNGPEAPETLTRADAQTLLDELNKLQTAPDSSLDEGAQASPPPRFGASINPAWGKRPADSSAGDAGTTEDRPQQRSSIVSPAEPLSAGVAKPPAGTAPERRSPAEHISGLNVAAEIYRQTLAATPDEGDLGAPESAAGEAREDRGREAAAPPEPMPDPDAAAKAVMLQAAQEAGQRVAGRTTPKPRRRPPAPSVAQVREAQQDAEATRKQTTIERENTPIQDMHPGFRRPFMEHFGGDIDAATTIVNEYVANWTAAGRWPAEGNWAPWSPVLYQELADGTFEGKP